MKELMFLMLFVCCTQFTSHKSDVNCGIVTDKFAPPLDKKSSCGSIPISYNANEYIVIMPQGKDSIKMNKSIIEYNLVLLKVSASNSSLRLYLRPDGGDTNPKPKPAPKPIIDDRIFRNSMVLNQKGHAVSLFETLSLPGLNQKKY